MRKPTKLEASVAAGLTAAGLAVAGHGVYESQKDDAPKHEAQEAPEASSAREAWEQRMNEAREAREAIVRRHAGCTITKVVDTHTSEVVESPYIRDKVPRNTVIVTVEATTTPESAAAEAKYAKGQPNADDVKWSAFEGAGDASLLVQDENNPDAQRREGSVPSRSTMVKAGTNTETFTITMYPRTDESRTTSAEISLSTAVETWNPEGNNGHGETYKNVGRVSCGVIYEDVDISDPTQLEPGPLTWQAAQGPAEGLKQFMYEEQTCLNVPTGPNSYAVDCN